jgi:hypothetical protein
MGSPPARPALSDKRRGFCGSPATRSAIIALFTPCHSVGNSIRIPAHVSFFGPNGSMPRGQRSNFAWNATALFLRGRESEMPYCITLRSRTDASITGWYGGNDSQWSTDYKRQKLFDKKDDARPVCDELRSRCPRNANAINIEAGHNDPSLDAGSLMFSAGPVSHRADGVRSGD